MCYAYRLYIINSVENVLDYVSSSERAEQLGQSGHHFHTIYAPQTHTNTHICAADNGRRFSLWAWAIIHLNMHARDCGYHWKSAPQRPTLAATSRNWLGEMSILANNLWTLNIARAFARSSQSTQTEAYAGRCGFNYKHKHTCARGRRRGLCLANYNVVKISYICPPVTHIPAAVQVFARPRVCKTFTARDSVAHALVSFAHVRALLVCVCLTNAISTTGHTHVQPKCKANALAPKATHILYSPLPFMRQLVAQSLWLGCVCSVS